MSASISVITAALNARNDLPRLIDSLRKQTDRDFDFVLADGGSVDGTLQYAHEADDVVSRVLGGPDSGIYDALNKAIRTLRTEFYVVAGADDVLFPDAIAKYRAAVAATGADVVVAGVKAGKSIRMGFHPSRAWLGHAAMVTSHSVGMLFRKSLHATYGEYSLRYPMLADGHFIKKLCASDTVRIVAGDFVAGSFGLQGMSNRNLARALCEQWQIQLDSGEHPLLQYCLFLGRLLRFAPRLTSRKK